MRSIRILRLMLWCMMLSHISSNAQTYISRIQHLNVRDGLSDNGITGLVKMDDGNLWIATMDGLNRYDGFSFQEFNTLNSKLNSNVIKCLTKTGNTLIVVTSISYFEPRGSGMFVYDSEKQEFIPFTDIFGPLPFSIAELRMCKAFNDVILFALNDGNGCLFDVRQRKWDCINPGSNMTFIYQDKILTSNEDSLRVAGMKDDVDEGHFPDPRLRQILAELITTGVKHYHIARSLELSGYSARRRLHWIPINNRLYGVNDRNQLITFLQGQKMLAFEREMRAIEIDDDHDMLFVGTDDGLFAVRVEPALFKTYFTGSPDSSYTSSRSFACRGIAVINDTLYANGPDGVYRTALVPQSETYPILPERMLPMHVVGGKDLLFGRSTPIRYHPANGTINTLVNSEIVSQLWSILVHKGLYFLGSSDGLTVLDSALLEQGRLQVVCENGLKGDALYVYNIQKVSGDLLCYATSKGLFIGRTDECEPRKISFRDPSRWSGTYGQFTHTLEDHDNTFWATTLDGGILHFQLDDTVAFVLDLINREEGLPSNTCYAIYPDRAGNKWVSTDLGIILLRPDLTFRVFTTADGLSNNEFNRISHFQDPHGNIYFGGLDGVVAFSPGDMEGMTPENLQLNILSFRQFSGWRDTVLDKTISVLSSQTVKFRAGDKFFEIQVGLNDLFETNLHTYEFRFPTISEEWEPMRGNALRQNTLPYGRHTLEIRGRNVVGELAGNTILLTVQALRPVYLTWWFLLTLAVGVILILREYLLNKTRQISKLGELVHQRTRIIEEQSEALRKAEAARSKFFANISHELRTPLALIKGPLEKLTKTSGNREALADKYAETMLNNVEMLQERIDDLLTLAQADAGQLKLNETPIHLNAFLERLADNLRGFADESKIRIVLQNDMPASMVIRADRKKVEHILINYLTNAIKHSDFHTTTVLRCHLQDAQLIFSVMDKGPGIAVEESSRIFDRFYQIGKSGGTGLGLALSRELAEVMNGSVWVESEAGSGSSFYLAIPFVKAVEEEDTPVDPTPTPDAIQEHNRNLRSNGAMHAARILCVEDNPAMRAFLVDEFSQYHVESCANGMEALQLLDSQSTTMSLPDCIISDIMMPVMDGFELLRKVKSTDAYNSIPFIMLTARAGVEDKLEALRIGVDDYISKPFNSEELKTRVINLIGRKEQKQDADVKTTEPPVIDNEWLRGVEEIIKNRLEETDLTIESIALDVHLSRSQFFRRLKAYTGLTPNMYIREVRLFKARDLLESGKVSSIKELSASVGFESPSYFSQLYLERFGYRPSAKLLR